MATISDSQHLAILGQSGNEYNLERVKEVMTIQLANVHRGFQGSTGPRNTKGAKGNKAARRAYAYDEIEKHHHEEIEPEMEYDEDVLAYDYAETYPEEDGQRITSVMSRSWSTPSTAMCSMRSTTTAEPPWPWRARSSDEQHHITKQGAGSTTSEPTGAVA